MRDQTVPCSLATTFERPVAASEDGYVAESQRRMLHGMPVLRDAYDLGGDAEAIAFTMEDDAPESKAYTTTGRLGPMGCGRLSALSVTLRFHTV